MRTGTRGTAGAVAAGAMVLCLAGVAWANVYPSGVAINSATFDTTTGTLQITYILNEAADAGVTIQVFNGTPTAVRTVNIARLPKGANKFEWDGRDDSGARVPNGNYTVKITASDYGYPGWTQISADGALNSFYVPLGVSINKNPASPNYGKIYVSEALGGQPTAAPARPAPTQDGIYMLYADGSDAGWTNGNHTWTGSASPYKSTIGADDHLYVADLSNDISFEFSADMSSVTQLTDAGNRTTNQWVGGIVVSGTQAAGNRTIYLADNNYNDGARKGMIMYNLGGAATAIGTGTGTQYIGPGFYSFYPYDYARDSAGNWYDCQFRYTSGQAPPISKFLDATPPINTAQWQAASSYTGACGIDIYEPKGWVAYGDYYTGYVRVFDMTTGAFISEFDAGSRLREVAFDAAGNIYTVDNTIERMRVWSPGDGLNSKDVTTAAVALNKSGSGGPVISAHPADIATCPDANVQFDVTATGGTLAYQWKMNGNNLSDGTFGTAPDDYTVSGATAATLSISTVPPSFNGAVFTCVVTDENGVAVSNPAVLTAGVAFTQAPASQAICQNGTATFSVAGTNMTGFQWQRATAAAPTTFSDIVGETTSTLVLNNVPAGDNGTRVRCNVSGPCGSATSPVGILTVSSGPILGNVATSYVTPNPRPTGSGATFYGLITKATGPVSYQWKREGVDLVDGTYPWGVVAGATSPNLVITELGCGASGRFTVGITDDCGTTTSTCGAAPGTAGQSCYLTVGVSEVGDAVSGNPSCSNGVDDDCDGLVDCADSGCANDYNCGPVCNTPFADWDGDKDVDMLDFADFQRCYAIAPVAYDPACECFDYNNDGSIDEDDATAFVACGSGPGIEADPNCDNRPGGQGKIVINEVAYDMIDMNGNALTDQFEFVELYNRSAETVDISGWILRASDVVGDDNRDFVIPGGVGSGTTLLAPGGFYVFSPNSVPVPPPNPPYLYWQAITDSPTDIWEDGPDALEILDANRDPVDTLIYARNLGTVAVAGEGAVWGNLQTVDNVDNQLSLARWFDGRDTNDNGRDFGLRRWTPGASNQGGAAVVSTYTLPAIDSLAAGSLVPDMNHAFQPTVVIDPTNATTAYDTHIVNPNAIPASPQGGKAAVAWDFATGGGNAAISKALMNNAGGFDLYVYLDTSFAAWGSNTGYESTSYGAVGTTDTKYYMVADPEGIIHGNVVTNNGNTGLAWVYNKVKGTTNSCKLYLVDAGAGGDSSSGTWAVYATIDMIAQPSGWYRLSIAYDGATGNVTANGPTGAVNFTTAAGLAGEFYVGYREGTPADPATAGSDISYLRPATFDSAP